MTTRQIAHGIAQLGRHGDSTLVHMQPHEVAGLQALAKANGTSMTINPHTGLPEAFSLGGVFRAALPIIAGAALGPGGMFGAEGLFGMGALGAGLTVGAATGLLTGSPLQGAMAGMGAYGGSNLYQTLSNAGAGVTKSAIETEANAARDLAKAGGQLSPEQIKLLNPSGFEAAQIANAPSTNELFMGNQASSQIASPAAQQLANNTAITAQPYPNYDVRGGYVPGSDYATSTYDVGNYATGANNYGMADIAGTPTEMSKFDYAMKGIKELPTKSGWEAYKAAGGSPMQLAMTAAGPVLSGIEPTDIYGQPIKYDTSGQKYDPYKTLNLNTNTGLRLYAAGGPVSFADGGDSNKELSLDPAGLPGGGAAALQGADQVEVTPGGTKLGIFATADQIDAARKADELAKAAQGRGLPGLGIMTGLDRGGYQGMAGFNRMYGGMGGMGSTAPTMISIASRNTAPTAQTAAPKYNYLEQLNLNKQYAAGGSVSQGGLQDLYNQSDDTTAGVALSQDGYGLGRLSRMSNMADGGMASYAKGGYLDGPGDGMSDSIPATIEGKQPARLADGEFVIPADVVSHLGNGSTKAGSERLYGMLDKVRKARTGTTKQGKKINPAKYMPA